MAEPRITEGTVESLDRLTDQRMRWRLGHRTDDGLIEAESDSLRAALWVFLVALRSARRRRAASRIIPDQVESEESER